MTRTQGRVFSTILICIFLAAGLFCRERAEETTLAPSVQSPFADAAKRASQSVVSVMGYTGRKRTQMGSGVAVSEKCVLTNYHVIEGADRISVSLAGKEIPADAIAVDEEMDAAVLFAEHLEAKPAELGDSDRLQVGEWVICVGNPLSETLRGSVTAGIVSALERKVLSSGHMIQTDAAINSGSSGGGLFNVLGELVGIPTMKYTGETVEGIGLVLPINSVNKLIQEALGGEKPE